MIIIILKSYTRIKRVGIRRRFASVSYQNSRLICVSIIRLIKLGIKLMRTMKKNIH